MNDTTELELTDLRKTLAGFPANDPSATLECMLNDFENRFGEKLKDILWELISNAYQYGHSIGLKEHEDGKA